MNEELLQLQTVCMIQTADVSSLLLVVQQLASVVRRDHPDLLDIDELFLRTRKILLQKQLEFLETTNPELAAKIQDRVDASCQNYPFGYD